MVALGELRNDSEELPGAGHTFQRVFTVVLKLETGACDEIGHSARDEDLAWLSKCRDSSTDVGPDSSDVITTALDFTGVHSDPDFDTERLQNRRQSTSARHATPGPIEGREYAVAG